MKESAWHRAPSGGGYDLHGVTSTGRTCFLGNSHKFALNQDVMKWSSVSTNFLSWALG